jgi:hypothetical protein
MNLVWFVEYLAVAFQAVAPILEAVWIAADPLLTELELLLIPLNFQLAEWAYPIDPSNAYPWLRTPHAWGRNPRLGPEMYFVAPDTAREFHFSLIRPGCFFVVKLDYPKLEYHFEEWGGQTVLANRTTWIERLLHKFYDTPLGPEKAADKMITLPPWLRTATGTWFYIPRGSQFN